MWVLTILTAGGDILPQKREMFGSGNVRGKSPYNIAKGGTQNERNRTITENGIQNNQG